MLGTSGQMKQQCNICEIIWSGGKAKNNCNLMETRRFLKKTELWRPGRSDPQ